MLHKKIINVPRKAIHPSNENISNHQKQQQHEAGDWLQIRRISWTVRTISEMPIETQSPTLRMNVVLTSPCVHFMPLRVCSEAMCGLRIATVRPAARWCPASCFLCQFSVRPAGRPPSPLQVSLQAGHVMPKFKPGGHNLLRVRLLLKVI